MRCRNIRPLIFFHIGLDISFNPTHVFFATELMEESAALVRSGQEVIGHEWVSLSRCFQMISAGQIVDGLTVLALLAYDRRQRELH